MNSYSPIVVRRLAKEFGSILPPKWIVNWNKSINIRELQSA